ncbi:MAG: hypothetical protein OEZ22_09730 [Spirochaetia bacterium]|nr:hypothetical protein [Spirochaetia bacterium]
MKKLNLFKLFPEVHIMVKSFILIYIFYLLIALPLSAAEDIESPYEIQQTEYNDEEDSHFFYNGFLRL